MAKRTRSASAEQQRNLHSHDYSDDGDDGFGYAAERMPVSGTSRQRGILGIMAVVQTVFLFGFAHLSATRKESVSNEPFAVKAVTDSSLDIHIAAHPNGTLVYFHTPGCSHCKTMAPEFEAAAKELQQIGDTSLVSLNADVAPFAVKRYSVSRFPQLLWFRHGELVREVPATVRTTTKILEFVDWALQPAVIDFASQDEFDEAVPQLRAALPTDSVPVLVGYDRVEGVEEALQKIGERFRGATAFLLVKGAREGAPHFRAYFQNPSADQDYNGTLESSKVRTWVKSLMVHKSRNGTSK